MKTYTVKELFNTLQGEGARSGARSVFVRFTGCNLWDGNPDHRDKGKGACARWCDTDFVKGDKYTADQLEAEMSKHWPDDGRHKRWCVLTGGEPMLQVDGELLAYLHKQRWNVAVETNGTVASDAYSEFDHICVSPKRGGGPLAFNTCDELKVVFPGSDTVAWTDLELLEFEDKLCPFDCFVQPQDPINRSAVGKSYLSGSEKDAKLEYESNLARCIAFVYRNPRWRLSVQVHKFSGLR